VNYLSGHWSLDPFVALVALAVVVHEIGLAHLAARSRASRSRERRRRSYAFYSGLALLLLSVCSPIDYWAGNYFFLHMIEHILVMFFAPVLIVIGAPWLPLAHGFPVRWRRTIGRAVLLSDWAAPLRRLGGFLSKGPVGVIGFNLVMIVWHIPAALDLAQDNHSVHVWVMLLSFFVSGIFYWLQILPSYPIKPKLSSAGQIWAIIGTNGLMFLIAMTLSIFTNSSWYSVYNHIPGVTLSPFADQQIGAAILWVCGDFWAVPALIVVVRRVIAHDGDLNAVLDRALGRRADAHVGEIS